MAESKQSVLGGAEAQEVVTEEKDERNTVTSEGCCVAPYKNCFLVRGYPRNQKKPIRGSAFLTNLRRPGAGKSHNVSEFAVLLTAAHVLVDDEATAQAKKRVCYSNIELHHAYDLCDAKSLSTGNSNIIEMGAGEYRLVQCACLVRRSAQKRLRCNLCSAFSPGELSSRPRWCGP